MERKPVPGVVRGKIILASASPRRRELLEQICGQVEVIPSPLPEPYRRPADLHPIAWAEALAVFKARSVADRNPGRIVLGADTVVFCDGQLLGKPVDLADARRMLQLQAGRWSDVITGVALVRVPENPSGGEPALLISHDCTRVFMRDDRVSLEEYLISGEWEGKAGAYGIQDAGDRLVERFVGSFTNVVGLPVELVERMLARFKDGLQGDEMSSAQPAAGGQPQSRSD